MVFVEADPDCKIEDRDTSCHKHRTKCFELYSQVVRESENYSTCKDADANAGNFIDPVFIDSELNKEGNTQDKNGDGHFTKNVLSDKFFKVRILLTKLGIP